jgi:hypothetical protein
VSREKTTRYCGKVAGARAIELLIGEFLKASFNEKPLASKEPVFAVQEILYRSHA